jgi:hypothetical protein
VLGSLGPWLLAFGLTLVVECPIVAGFSRGRAPLGRRLLLAAFASLATHPAVWFIFPELPLEPRLALGLSEVWAAGTEAVFYGLVLLPWRRAVVAAVVANAASFGLGLVLVRWTPVFGWV